MQVLVKEDNLLLYNFCDYLLQFALLRTCVPSASAVAPTKEHLWHFAAACFPLPGQRRVAKPTHGVQESNLHTSSS
jgi:hypothetical protein